MSAVSDEEPDHIKKMNNIVSNRLLQLSSIDRLIFPLFIGPFAEVYPPAATAIRQDRILQKQMLLATLLYESELLGDMFEGRCHSRSEISRALAVAAAAVQLATSTVAV